MSLELRNYMKTAHPGMEISKPGCLKQRMKLNPLAFYELYRHHNRNFYADPGFSVFHGYLVLAADGSGINIPTTKETLEEFGHITLRMIKVPLPEGKEEVLITNLPSETFDSRQIAELYHMRWGIETAYETLKDRLQIENFTGTRPVLLLQDIYSTIYVSNLAEDIIRDAEAELDEKEKHRKHKMMVNRTLSIGILKNDLIYILLETDAQKQDRLFHQIYEDISKNLVPIRPDRHYHRTKGQLAGKYSNTHKRAY